MPGLLKDDLSVPSDLVYGTRQENPFVSIMITTYNRPTMLMQCVKSALEQKTEIEYEIVIVDNSEEIDAAVMEFLNKKAENRVCWYHNSKNLGMVGNWNRGLSLAKGKWVLILHDDDTLHSDYVETLGKFVRNGGTNVAAIGCAAERIDENGQPPVITRFVALRKLWAYFLVGRYSAIKLKDMYYRNLLRIVGLLINKEFALEIGGFDEKYGPCADVDFMTRMLLTDKNVYLLHRKLFNYRIAENESMNPTTIIKFIQYQYHQINMLCDKCCGWSEGIARWHRDCSVIKYPQMLKAQLVKGEHDELEYNIQALLDSMNLKERSKLSLKIHELLMKLYALNIKTLRSRKC